jgi:hypothetical protein
VTRLRAVSLLAAACACGLVVTACGGSTATTTTTTTAASDGQGVVFGNGVIPSSVPSDFPIPEGAVVGSTMVDHVNDRSEFRLDLAQDAGAVVEFYTTNLASAGYAVSSAPGDPTTWDLRFSKDALAGQIIIQSSGSNLAVVVVSINRS